MGNSCHKCHDGNELENNFGDKIVFGTVLPHGLVAALSRLGGSVPAFNDYRRLELGLNYAYRRSFDATQRWIGIRPRTYSNWLIEEGTIELVGPAFERTEAGAGSWIFIFPDTERDQTIPSGTRLLSINLTALWRPSGDPLLPYRHPFVVPRHLAEPMTAVANRLLDTELEIFPQPADPERRLPPLDYARFQARFHEWLEEWLSLMSAYGSLATCPEPPPDHRIQAVVDRLERLGHCHRLPYDELTRLSGLSRPHLDRLFRRHMGKTPKELSDRLLLERARHMLEDVQLGNKETAAALGFASSSYFATWFKRLTGKSPGCLPRGARQARS